MFKETIEKGLKEAIGEEPISLDIPDNEIFGDYSTNVGMILAKKTGKKARDVSIDLVGKLQKDEKLQKIVGKIEFAEPGFINFWLADEVLRQNLTEISQKGEKYPISEEGSGKTVVVDYSSPNIAKRFGIGHLRSTVIGQALYNLYLNLGYKVIGDNHLGDWGTQFGTLLYQIDGNKLKVEELTIDGLEELYVDFNNKATLTPELWDEARVWFKKLEDGDEQVRHIWKTVVEISMAEFNRVYDKLGIKIDHALGESFYEEKMPAVIEELRNKKLVKKSEGAEIIEFPDLSPAMLTKSDGTTTYFTRDLATIKYRIETWDPTLFIYEVGSDQILHFRQVFATAKVLGWNDMRHYEHVAHGLIRFLHGKMSTRRGETVKLEDVLDEATARAKRTIEKSETGRGLDESEKDRLAGMVGIGAIKYFDLMHHPASDIVFDWDKLFVLEGNSGPYLQYTVARINSLLAKAKTVDGQPSTVGCNPEEKAVLRALIHFPDVISLAAKSFSPNLLANYLFDLAQKFNNFYNNHRIIGDASQEFRIALSSGTGQVLKNGLAILGIETPERM